MQTVDRAQAIETIRQDLQGILDGHGRGLVVGDIYFRRTLRIKGAGEITWDVDASSLRMQPGRQMVTAALLLDGQRKTEARFNVMLRQRVRVAVLERALQRGEVVTAHDFIWRDVELNRADDGFVEADNEIIGMAVKRMIRTDVPLKRAWFQPPVVVSRNDRVRVKIVNGLLSIQTEGIALQDGRMGDRIQVLNPTSKRRYLAKVVGRGMVMVEQF